jgi:aldehyde:ferredoxin oxidoreductase
MLGYDHELIYAMGSLLGIDLVPGMLQVIDEAEIQGLDVMSTGVVLAWATEAFEQGIISLDETGDLRLSWGDSEAYIEAVKRIVTQPTDLYRALARGVDYAAEVYGGLDYALSFGGNEMPGYHTGPGCHLGYLSGARHSHLDSAGYSLDQKALTSDDSLVPEAVAESLWQEESWRQVLSSLVICFFARGIYDPEIVAQALSTIGVDVSPKSLQQLGSEILLRKHEFKMREGFSLKEIRIPKRILDTPSSLGVIDERFLRRALNWTTNKLNAIQES